MLKSELPREKDSMGEIKNNSRNNEKPSPKEVALPVRIILGIVFAILGFMFSNSVYFDTYPLFNTPFLAEFLFFLVMGLVGFYLVPKAFSAVKHWVWEITFQAVSDIVTDFWEKQTEKMKESREEKEEKKKKAKETRIKEEMEGNIVLDTSVLIDGRILDIAKTGVLTCGLIVPDFVIDELHTLSDSKDSLKRRKGRRGLDLLKALKKDRCVEVSITKDLEVTDEGVDKSLVEFARKYKVSLMTMDFNLNKVASVSDIKVINLNDLANALRMRLLPGEELEIEIKERGQEKDQGVGYLEDGTMVVVEKGSNRIGEKVKVVVKKNLQGSAGQMIFAELS